MIAKKHLRKRAEKIKKEEHKKSEKLYNQISEEDKTEYKNIMKQLKQKNLPENTILNKKTRKNCSKICKVIYTYHYCLFKML